MEGSGNKLFKREMPIFWWTKRWSHIKFVLRELTSLSVAFFALEMALLIFAISGGPDGYDMFLRIVSHPVLIIFNLIAFTGLIFHSITWFNLAPKAMVIKIGKVRLPGFVVAGSNYLAWIVISVIIFWLLAGY